MGGWNQSADRDLLLAIIDGQSLKAIDWKAVAANLESKKYEFSNEACRQHFQKIRREARGGGSSTPSLKTPTSGKSTSKGRKFDSFAEANVDDNEDIGTPSKAPRAKKVKKEKTEDLGGLAGQTGPQFKIEEHSSGNDSPYDYVVDVENDEYYTAN